MPVSPEMQAIDRNRVDVRKLIKKVQYQLDNGRYVDPVDGLRLLEAFKHAIALLPLYRGVDGALTSADEWFFKWTKEDR